MLGLQKVDWEQKARDGWLCHEFFGGIHLYHGGRDDAGVELSGAGCRMLETCNGNSFDWIALFSYIREQGDEMNPRPAPLSAVPHGTAAPQPYSYALTSEQQRRHQRLQLLQPGLLCGMRRAVVGPQGLRAVRLAGQLIVLRQGPIYRPILVRHAVCRVTPRVFDGQRGRIWCC